MNARALSLFCVTALSSLVLTDLAASARPPAVKGRPAFAGTWVGEYTASTFGGDQVGEVTMTVDNDGNIKGEAVNRTINQTATVKGSINKDGKSSIEFEFPGQSASAYGTVVKTSKGLVTGTMTQRNGKIATGSIEFELKPKAN